MAWGTVELEPEVRERLERLTTEQFATAAFYKSMRWRRATTMAERESWDGMRERRLAEPGAAAAYAAERLAFELGAAVRELRVARKWSQAELAAAAGMTQSAVARFEAGGTTPTLPVLSRIAGALDADLTVRVSPRTGAA
jgi:ribosome-binding protein aMBF1 (putative translation factor)